MKTVYDYQRRERLGMPEAIFCEGKDVDSLDRIIEELADSPDHPVLFTRLQQSQFNQLTPALAALLDYDSLSATGVLHGALPQRPGKVAVVTAGTSDLRVALEATRTLGFMGVDYTLVSDVGVAGIWRLLERVEDIKHHDVIIVAAGMDAALPTVMAGLVGKCVIGVPTSVGYGVAAGGQTALNAMLASCGQGVLVTNIDNGFGAACAAVRILNAFNPVSAI
ncbi:nickel pincer cofactor biosynthesis protein LarB [Pseudomonas sp. PDM31]|uniref:nickel pincer cofactor biosynthesis protein LarB n=1 Tax=Pseudomonas sp. PDM31 TaxID=2854778 RepID=UPI001C456062|nr:nickel pincer cofactor biosynthesis protein LarB [Pseudomonas sp. PDM31]MBV7477602.1 nickel pincer cofactor biosynthesis protein LarB [Pseudomonas sp. PDM31]